MSGQNVPIIRKRKRSMRINEKREVVHPAREEVIHEEEDENLEIAALVRDSPNELPVFLSEGFRRIFSFLLAESRARVGKLERAMREFRCNENL